MRLLAVPAHPVTPIAVLASPVRTSNCAGRAEQLVGIDGRQVRWVESGLGHPFVKKSGFQREHCRDWRTVAAVAQCRRGTAGLSDEFRRGPLMISEHQVLMDRDPRPGRTHRRPGPPENVVCTTT